MNDGFIIKAFLGKGMNRIRIYKILAPYMAAYINVAILKYK